MLHKIREEELNNKKNAFKLVKYSKKGKINYTVVELRIFKILEMVKTILDL